MRRLGLVFWPFCFIPFIGVVNSFTFSLDGQPGQCDPLTFSWSGGQAPFRLIIIVPGANSLNLTIPDSSFQNNTGSYKVSALPVPKNTQVYFAMSDATGAVSGGTSILMAVGDSLTGASCNTTMPTNDFFFSADSVLTQCADFPFTSYEGAIKPLTIFAFIPGGSESFVLPYTPSPNNTFHWKANITAQTQVTFAMIDSKGRDGGTDKLRIVAPSNDKSCLLQSNGTSLPSDTPGSNSEAHPGRLPTGAIVGIAIGGVVFLVVLIILLLWSKRQSKPKKSEGRRIDLGEDFHQGPESPQPMIGLEYAPTPFLPVSARQSTIDSSTQSQLGELPRPLVPRVQSQYYDDSSPSSESSSASGSRRARFVVHRDIEEDDAPVELPPQYNDRRAPIPGLDASARPSPSNQTRKQ